MKKKIYIIGLCLGFIVSLFFVFSRTTKLQVLNSTDQGKPVTTEEFKGVTTNGQLIPNLFKIKSTGVSIKPAREASEAFLNSLSEEQRKKTIFPVADNEWMLWNNRHSPPRQGIGFYEMNERQRASAFALFRASLSAKGLQKTADIMKLNETLAELTNNYKEFGEGFFWVTVMGNPSDTEPWGWQLDGHHLVINYFVMGDQVVMTPTFTGAEPIRAESGKYKGTVVMQDEQNKGHRLFASLGKEQQSKAIVRSEKGRSENLAEAYKDNLVLDYAGIPASQLNEQQKILLLDLIGEYVGNLKDGHARVKMDEVKSHLDQTYFAWIGGTAPDGVFYYRLQSPVILIEFDHQPLLFVPPAKSGPRNHIHSVVRTPNGNDYGKDLLRQHHERHKH